MDREIMRIKSMIGEHHGRSSAEALALERMSNALLLVRSEMENRYRQESPGRVDVCRVYFGP